MKIKQTVFISVLLLLFSVGGRAQNQAECEYDEVSGWLKVTSSGTVDLSTFTNKPVTVIEITSSSSDLSTDVTFSNLTGNYKGVGDGGTLLNPQGGTLKNNVSTQTCDTYVLMDDIDGGTYTISPSGLGTLCFPNNISFGEDEMDIRAFRAVRVETVDANTGVLVLEDAVDDNYGILANTPVILYKPEGGELVLGSAEKVSQAPTVISESGNLLVGINNTMTVQPEDGHVHYLMQSHDGKVGFYPALTTTNGNSLTPRSFQATRYRCYLDLPAQSNNAKALSFTIPDKSSAITAVEDNAAPIRDGFYTLNGQPVTHPLPGKVYIMRLDGRATKILIR